MPEPAVTPGWRKSSYSGNGGTGCVEVGAIPWRKSTYSENGGTACVEAAHAPGQYRNPHVRRSCQSRPERLTSSART